MYLRIILKKLFLKSTHILNHKLSPQFTSNDRTRSWYLSKIIIRVSIPVSAFCVYFVVCERKSNKNLLFHVLIVTKSMSATIAVFNSGSWLLFKLSSLKHLINVIVLLSAYCILMVYNKNEMNKVFFYKIISISYQKSYAKIFKCL